MKIKMEYLIPIGLIAALAAYLVMRNTDRTLYDLPAIPAVAAREFTRIEIADHRTATLTKADEKWLIQPRGYPADPGRVKDMLASLSTLELTALASESSDYRRYDLDAGHKISVKAWTGDTLRRDFDLGKTAPSFRHTFIRLAGDPRVFHARDNFRNKFDLEPAALQDKAVLRLEAAAIKTVKITAAAESAQFERKEKAGEKAAGKEHASEWLLAGGNAAEGAAVEKLIGLVGGLKCQEFIDNLDKQALTEPIYTLVLENGGSHTLAIFAKQQDEADRYPATSSQSDFPFYLGASLAEQIMKQPDALMPKADAEKAEEKKSDVPLTEDDGRIDSYPHKLNNS